MTTVGEQITNTAGVISANIEDLRHRRDLLSQNVLAQLRNLVEGVAVLVHTGRPDDPITYPKIQAAVEFIKANGRHRHLDRLHRMLLISASHYTVDGENSERLMLKYYEHLLRLREVLRSNGYADLLANLEDFQTELGPQMRGYHEKIAHQIEVRRAAAEKSSHRNGRFYVERSIPFFVDGRVFYEVTLSPAVNRVSKFDRAVAFTDLDLDEHHAVVLHLVDADIDIFDQSLPITLVVSGDVSIRPCEYNNFAKLFGQGADIKTGQREYRCLNAWLTSRRATLLDLVLAPEQRYQQVRGRATEGVVTPRIFPALDEARRIITSEQPGHNLLRLLLLRMRNDVIKAQYDPTPCPRLSNLYMKWACLPFERAPFATSPAGHNPRYWDLVRAIDSTDRKHELLARRVRNNIEAHGRLYTPLDELAAFGDVPTLVSRFNGQLHNSDRQQQRRLIIDKNHVVIKGYEDDTAAIVTTLQRLAGGGIPGHRQAVESWLASTTHRVDDPVKADALKDLFEQSRVALIYGAAGTGKSTMLCHIAKYLDADRKLFLAQTHAAVDNLRARLRNASNADFSTIHRHLHRASDTEYDLLVIDECSTVSNADLLEVIKRTDFTQLVLVGDVYQIEAIQFGNWFAILPAFLPDSAVFELTTPYRTTNEQLITFWNEVRNLDDTIAETIAKAGYSTSLDSSLFTTRDGRDEIILCLHYDGLYGINNINRFLQASNPGTAVTNGVTSYKVGDPILFNDSGRFRPLIHNNTKGIIVGLHQDNDGVDFDIELTGKTITADDVQRLPLIRVNDTTIRLRVSTADRTDQDIDQDDGTVPFQIAYAVSIHKAQGLEYQSVKIVITDATEDDITHNILYTAITRAREQLQIYWTPETQQAILARLQHTQHEKDAALISVRKQLYRRQR